MSAKYVGKRFTRFFDIENTWIHNVSFCRLKEMADATYSKTFQRTALWR